MKKNLILSMAALAMCVACAAKNVPPKKPDAVAVSGNLERIGESLDRTDALAREIERKAKEDAR